MLPHQYNDMVNQVEGTRPVYTPEENKYFKELCAMVKAKQLTMNQAYKNACGGYPYVNADGDQTTKGGFKGSFQLWVDHAVNNGWVQESLQIVNGIRTNYGPEAQLQAQVDAENERNFRNPRTGLYIGIAVVAIAAIAVVVMNKKENS